jgi:hypothetical protein
MFDALFRESKGKPVTYKGRLVQLIDSATVHPKSNIRLSFEAKEGRYRQGVRIKSNGYITVAGERLRDFVLWTDTAPPVVELTVGPRTTELKIWNCWDHGDGVTQAWLNGGAMVVEKLKPGARKYFCNDGLPNDDFTDLVFILDGLVT